MTVANSGYPYLGKAKKVSNGLFCNFTGGLLYTV